jgi:hypothetical protein
MKKNIKSFPEKGQDSSSLLTEMMSAKESDLSWKNGKMFGYVFYPGDEEAAILEKVHHLFCSDNALNSSLFNGRQLT